MGPDLATRKEELFLSSSRARAGSQHQSTALRAERQIAGKANKPVPDTAEALVSTCRKKMKGPLGSSAKARAAYL